ncbi:MAG: hypothetical protein IJU21_06885 [Bacteroidales bacterium]|nr:hypothetical protein [Bacteroidales bacterium]
MKEFENIVTDLPYKESAEYVESLVERCTTAAAKSGPAPAKVVRPWFYAFAGAAAAAAVILGVFLFTNRTSPMDSFLASLTDEEAAMIVDLPITDIPEYYQ